MNPRERVRAALEHQAPQRTPFSWGLHPTPEMAATLERFLAEQGLSWPRLFHAVEDTYRIQPRYTGPTLPKNTDLWGIRRKKISYGAGAYDEFAFHPLAGMTQVEQIHAYPWPDPASFDYAGARLEALAQNRDQERAGKLWIDVCGNPLETYTWMTGMEEMLTNLLTQPEVVHAALDHICAYFEAKMELAASHVTDLVDICYFADDVGGQHRPLFSARLYREMIQPYHQRLITCAKALFPQAAMMLHSDGSVFDLLPDLIAAGVEVLEAVQVDAARMEPERLKQAFGEQLAFHGGISVQSLLPFADEAAVERECQTLVRIFGAGGGYIAAPTHCIQAGTPPENVLAMLRGILGETAFTAALKSAAG
jgi:uroporphyrinogen decarboxylase